jgi:hypothetical protein
MNTLKTTQRPWPVKVAFEEPALLYSREHVAKLYGCSVATVIRLEKSGRLDPVKLRGPGSVTHYRASQVRALAETGGV